MSLVVDSSIALAWCFEDEHTQLVMDLLDRVTETGAWPFSRVSRSGLSLSKTLNVPLYAKHRTKNGEGSLRWNFDGE